MKLVIKIHLANGEAPIIFETRDLETAVKAWEVGTKNDDGTVFNVLYQSLQTHDNLRLHTLCNWPDDDVIREVNW